MTRRLPRAWLIPIAGTVWLAIIAAIYVAGHFSNHLGG
jgi:hypothetical protein